MPYRLRTDHVGVVSVHDDRCPARTGRPCACGPLAYRAGAWDWSSGDWIDGPPFETVLEAREWQRAAHGMQSTSRPAEAAEADPSEQLFWWAFCFVGVGFFGVALALFLSDIVA